MKYACLDIETTGLDPFECQILEVAVVVDHPDAETLAQCDILSVRVKHDILVGTPYALNMNQQLLKEMASATEEDDAIDEFNDFLKLCFEDEVVFAGKNVAGFDLPFLREQSWLKVPTSHRTLDPGSMFFTGATVPSLDDCARYCHIKVEEEHRHEALYDALLVAAIIRVFHGRDFSFDYESLRI